MKPLNKGLKGDECYRECCSNQPASFYNKSTWKYYCRECAEMLNHVNRRDALALYNAPLCEEDKEIDHE